MYIVLVYSSLSLVGISDDVAGLKLVELRRTFAAREGETETN